MNDTLWGITWGSPGNIIYAPLLILVGSLLYVHAVRTRKLVSVLTNARYSGVTLINFSWWRQALKTCCFLGGVTLLFIGLLKPQWDNKEIKIAQEGRDVFIMLDISKSMLAQDCKPNRLACAKKKIKELVETLACDRAGLILFSGSSLVQCPLTTDYAAFHMFLQDIDVDTISSGSTALDKAIEQAIRAFSAMPERKNKLVVLFTDGEDFSTNLADIKKQAQQQGLHIFTVGVGTQQGAPIPLFDAGGKAQGHQRDKKGNIVISRLNEGILTALSEEVGGTFITMTADNRDINQLAQAVSAFEKEKLEDKKVIHYQEQYPYFLMVSFLLLLLEWIL